MREFQRAIIFTKIPLGGFFKYKDVFQIFPADLEGLPVSKSQKHYPNILEYWISDDEKINRETEFDGLQELYNQTAATVLKTDKIISLLTTFSNNLFFRYTDLTGIWGIPVLKDDFGEEANTWASKWCMPLFFFPGFPEQMKITGFTKVNIKSIPRFPHRFFYIFYPNLDHDSTKTVVFPDTMERSLDCYFQLDKEKMRVLDSAIHFAVSASDLLETKRTLSLLCSFTALESMIDLEYRAVAAERCEVCGQLKFSISKKFRDFLLKYIASDDSNKKKFNAYYSLRSKVIHTGQTLHTEKLFSDVPQNEKESELITRLEILQIGKLSIANWLMMNQS